MKNDPTDGKPLTAARIITILLKQEMAMPDDSIWLANQNRKIPNDDRLYISVGMVDSQVIGNVNRTAPTVGGMSETQEIVMRENIQIDIFSRSNDAEFRRWEVVAGLKSIYATQLQEENEFRIFQIPTSFINSSSAEGGSNINRFSVIVATHVWYKKTKTLATPSGDYYDEFGARVDDAVSIETATGIIELTLTEA